MRAMHDLCLHASSGEGGLLAWGRGGGGGGSWKEEYEGKTGKTAERLDFHSLETVRETDEKGMRGRRMRWGKGVSANFILARACDASDGASERAPYAMRAHLRVNDPKIHPRRHAILYARCSEGDG